MSLFRHPPSPLQERRTSGLTLGLKSVLVSQPPIVPPPPSAAWAGLRQDASYRTVLWLFNPSDQATVCDLVYRALDGSVLGRLDGVTLARQGAERPHQRVYNPVPCGAS